MHTIRRPWAIACEVQAGIVVVQLAPPTTLVTRHERFSYVDAYFCVFLPTTVGNVGVRVTVKTGALVHRCGHENVCILLSHFQKLTRLSKLE